MRIRKSDIGKCAVIGWMDSDPIMTIITGVEKVWDPVKNVDHWIDNTQVLKIFDLKLPKVPKSFKGFRCKK